MCLFLKNNVKYIATSNIYVWKALISVINGYYSPIFSYQYNLGETHKSPLDNYTTVISKGLHSLGYNVKIFNPYVGRYDCYGSAYNRFNIGERIDTIGLFIIPEGSHYYTDGYFYASDTLKLLRTLPKNEFFNYMINR